MTQANAAILGASGYTGAELVRLLGDHPGLNIAALSADRKAGQSFGAVFPQFDHLRLPALVAIEDIDFSNIEIVFACLPHGITQTTVAGLPEHVKVVDLSADFRLRDPAVYEKWYGGPHKAMHLQGDVAYGLPEHYRADIAQARITANTGCYVATALLPLLPLLSQGIVDPDPIVIDAKSGVTGAGRALREGSLFSEVSEGFHAYGVAGHRHMAELDQEFSKAAGAPVTCSFTPHLLPQNRGILATIYARGDANAAHAALRDAYAEEMFVHVLPLGQTPQTRHVRGSNMCRIGVVPDRIPGRMILVSVIDNLMKGASGQAVQNANIMLDLPEDAGLSRMPIFP